MEQIEQDSEVIFSLRLAEHIRNPCSVIVDGERKYIGDFYVREAEKAIQGMSNPFAIDFLKGEIEDYEVRQSSQ